MHIFRPYLTTPTGEGVRGNVIWCQKYQDKVKGKESKKYIHAVQGKWSCHQGVVLKDSTQKGNFKPGDLVQPFQTLHALLLGLILLVQIPQITQIRQCISYLFLRSKLSQRLVAQNNKHLLSHTFFGISGIQEQLSQEVLTRNLS